MVREESAGRDKGKSSKSKVVGLGRWVREPVTVERGFALCRGRMVVVVSGVACTRPDGTVSFEKHGLGERITENTRESYGILKRDGIEEEIGVTDIL